MAYLLLAFSIVLEVCGSILLKVSNGFTKFLPVVGVLIGYGLAFYLLAKTLRYLPLGVVYATWSGAGTILTTIAGVLIFKEKINKQAYIGIALLTVGLLMMNVVE
ncbi:DMT family transporter [Oceanobacillus saliphilus]|uniref:DMT family transporter n=1 Tax=Oceanobacillus saliphilus TaxID=2925834 RepID=UPI00201DB566|nr:multidrug efflux SMR transporter [Oceanobacillus saliphilus]